MGNENFKLKALDPQIHGLIEDVIDKEYLDRLTKLISESIEPPYAISINGEWGFGKSSQMIRLKEELDKKDFFTVWFNAWEYEYIDKPDFALVQTIARKFKEQFGDEYKKLKIFAATLGIGIVDSTVRFFTGGSVSYEKMKNISEDVNEALGKSYEQEEDFIKVFKEEFVDLTKKISDRNEKPLIVFIDDLDRCLPDNAVKILEMIKNLFVVNNAQAIFICGIDTGVAKLFIEQRYQGLPESFAINYFKKIFNLTLDVSLVNSDDINKLLIRYFQSLGYEEGEYNIIIKLLFTDQKILLAPGGKNPRTIFNIINRYYIYSRLNKPEDELDLNLIFTLIIFREVWPNLFWLFQKECHKGNNNLNSIIKGAFKNRDDYFLSDVEKNTFNTFLSRFNNQRPIDSDKLIESKLV